MRQRSGDPATSGAAADVEGQRQQGRRRWQRGSKDKDNDDGGGGGGGGHLRQSSRYSSRDDCDDNDTRLNVCDASTAEKERPSNLSWMHATIK